MVYKSLNDESYGEYTKYDSIRKLRTVHANVYGASVEGVMNSSHTEKNTWARSLPKYPTRSEWFEFFSLGCLKLMGQVTKINLDLSVPVLLEALIVSA